MTPEAREGPVDTSEENNFEFFFPLTTGDEPSSKMHIVHTGQLSIDIPTISCQYLADGWPPLASQALGYYRQIPDQLSVAYFMITPQ